jgi:hypothetical protein
MVKRSEVIFQQEVAVPSRLDQRVPRLHVEFATTLTSCVIFFPAAISRLFDMVAPQESIIALTEFHRVSWRRG